MLEAKEYKLLIQIMFAYTLISTLFFMGINPIQVKPDQKQSTQNWFYPLHPYKHGYNCPNIWHKLFFNIILQFFIGLCLKGYLSYKEPSKKSIQLEKWVLYFPLALIFLFFIFIQMNKKFPDLEFWLFQFLGFIVLSYSCLTFGLIQTI